jgi:tRNA A37 threonylcarbamoyladenosine dehydratase
MSDTDLERRFGGMKRLHGAEAAARIAAAHVCVIGIGGVGSWAAEALARSGVSRLTLIDLDHVAESNINRQVHALGATLGQAKVLAMRDRIADINPQCEVACVEEFITPDNLADVLPDCDAVVDAIDQVKAKAALIAWCRRNRIALVTTGGAGGRSDPTQLRIDDLSRTIQDPLASKVRAKLRKEYGFPRDPKKKFGVDCVYSIEPLQRPQSAACDLDEAGLHGLNCAGYGSSVCVTAAFGLAAAARIQALILRA